jgi:hypothetical protein
MILHNLLVLISLKEIRVHFIAFASAEGRFADLRETYFYKIFRF